MHDKELVSEPREGRLGEPSRVAGWGMGERMRRHADTRCGSEPHPILAKDTSTSCSIRLAGVHSRRLELLLKRPDNLRRDKDGALV